MKVYFLKCFLINHNESFSSQGKFNVFIIFLILAISSSLVGKLTSTYDKDILFKLVLTDLPKDKVVYDKSHDSVMLKVRGMDLI